MIPPQHVMRSSRHLIIPPRPAQNTRAHRHSHSRTLLSENMLHSQHEKRLTTHDVDAHTDTKRKITRPANKHTHGVSRWIGEEAHAQSTAEGAGGKQRGRGGGGEGRPAPCTWRSAWISICGLFAIWAVMTIGDLNHVSARHLGMRGVWACGRACASKGCVCVRVGACKRGERAHT